MAGMTSLPSTNNKSSCSTQSLWRGRALQRDTQKGSDVYPSQTCAVSADESEDPSFASAATQAT
ncbi:hypothetical protein PCASD_14696 [Puccinia coronata f. sp. avenae]|uniref:Uncharacterized protein n=1 Tax=Puccinia coronata f. sp. avenae TaxID=200324 RepID=A0A2N5TEJ4_9BASI|nr:hypothetical protein PCASD_14696 [Puccinia coronata f. sp. avenae]